MAIPKDIIKLAKRISRQGVAVIVYLPTAVIDYDAYDERFLPSHMREHIIAGYRDGERLNWD